MHATAAGGNVTRAFRWECVVSNSGGPVHSYGLRMILHRGIDSIQDASLDEPDPKIDEIRGRECVKRCGAFNAVRISTKPINEVVRKYD